MNYVQAYYQLHLAIVYKEDKVDYFTALQESRKQEDVSFFTEFMFSQYNKFLKNEMQQFRKDISQDINSGKQSDKQSGKQNNKGKGYSLFF
jgi:hypothetical protein